MTVRNRRRALGGLAALALTPWLQAHAQPARRPTPALTEGPFYPTEAALERDADLARIAGRSPAAGTPLAFTGRVVDTRGRPLSGRVVEIWHCDEYGNYHLVGHRDRTTDAGFQGWGEARTGEGGDFAFRTIRPPAYPGRTPHIHFTVRDDRNRRVLTSQAFFEGDPGNAKDFLYRQLGEDARRVTMRLASEGRGLRGELEVVLAA
ncbi:MAG: intradiol ring-cleavage dioxygenase [Betaproteobacteria bacterium]|nr:intradiol ring-cleavage dioxygenase [Betaproteobacteria bacterium]